MTKHKYVGVNCSKCGRWVGKDGFIDAGYDSDGIYELGYPLCKRCLDAQGPTVYDLQVELRTLKQSCTPAAKERIAYLESQIKTRMQKWNH